MEIQNLPPDQAFPANFEPSDVPYELFSEEHHALRKTVRVFVEKELAPHTEQWEEQEDYPRDIFLKLGEVGFHGMKFPESLGGSGPDYVAEVVVSEELVGMGSGGIAADLGAHRDLACLYIYNFGTDEQRKRWIPPAMAGEVIGALAVTEPDAGSDVAGIKTRAAKDGDSYVLNGSKIFVTNGSWSDFVVVAAKTDPSAGHSGLSLFIVEKGTPGFTQSRMRMLGWRTSHTGELSFEDCRVPAENLLGESEGQAFVQIMQNFQWERLSMAVAQTAGAVRTYGLAKKYALQRKAFGREIGHFQVWRHRFADLASEIEMSRALTYHALRLFVNGIPCTAQVSMAKMFSSEIAFKMADECVQVHGGYGYMMEFPAQRAWRDSRLGPIGGGTSEIMKEIIGKSLGL